MPAEFVVNADLVNVYPTSDGRTKKAGSTRSTEGADGGGSQRRGRRSPGIRTLAWGDYVEVIERTAGYLKVRTTYFEDSPDGPRAESREGYIVPGPSSPFTVDNVLIRREDSRVLKVNFIDVQQGDGSVIETPDGKVIVIDGGDNQLFARYLANRFRGRDEDGPIPTGTAEENPRRIDCMVVTHGDQDHFLGLAHIEASERDTRPEKQLFVYPLRVYHNGLIKRPDKVPEKDRLGTSVKVGKERFITGLVDDLLAADPAAMNEPFLAWRGALERWNERTKRREGKPIEFRRLWRGEDDAFDFLKETDYGVPLDVQVLGPIQVQAGGKPALPFLGRPEPRWETGEDETRFSGTSASHTINGHSILFRLTYGKWRFMFTGDLNEEAAATLVEAHKSRSDHTDLQSEILKVPHHGAAEFAVEFFKCVSPVVSVISSGDEQPSKDHIHPRATAVGALGRFSRIDEPLIFATELVAFFQMVGPVTPEFHRLVSGKVVLKGGKAERDKKALAAFFAFRRALYGSVKIRTDGEHLLVYTASSQAERREAYRYRMDASGVPLREQVRIV